VVLNRKLTAWRFDQNQAKLSKARRWFCQSKIWQNLLGYSWILFWHCY